MAGAVRSFLSWGSGPTATTMFPGVSPEIDGQDCDHDCASCDVRYPANFKTESMLPVFGVAKPWDTHLLVATGKTDWAREVSDEKGSLMEAIGSVKGMKLSASNLPLPENSTSYADPTRVLLLPAMTTIDNVTTANVKTLVANYIKPSLKTTSPLGAEATKEAGLVDSMKAMQIAAASPSAGLQPRPCQHKAIILLCSQKTRDARCGQSAPLMKKELERHLRPLNLFRDISDDRPGGVGIYFISHVGGHKWSANVIIYRRPDPWGVEGKGWAEGGIEEMVKKAANAATNEDVNDTAKSDGAGQCIWLARVRPEDCEGLVKYTLLQGKVVKPKSQLRAGFDRGRGLVSW